MSRAFVKEDAGSWGDPGKRYSLPSRDDPGYDEAAAEALLEGAHASNLRIVNAPDVIGMDEHPTEAVKGKPESSINASLGGCQRCVVSLKAVHVLLHYQHSEHRECHQNAQQNDAQPYRTEKIQDAI